MKVDLHKISVVLMDMLIRDNEAMELMTGMPKEE